MNIHESQLNPVDDSNSAGGERVMSETARHALEGIWFAFAAVIPVGYFYWQNPLGEGFSGNGDSMIWSAAVPVLISGICGLGLGADILNPVVTKNAFQAAGRGLLIALLSYLVLFVGLVVVIIPKSPDPVGIILAGGIFFFYGLIFLGWLIVLVGAAAGALLYYCRRWRLGS